MTKQLTIRVVKRSDIESIAHLSRVEIERGLPWFWTPKRLKRFLALSTTNCYVAELGGQFVGFSIASLCDVRAHLVLLAVDKKFRKRGIGLELLNWQIKSAQTAGLTDLSLEVRTTNLPAQQFYYASGFKTVRTLPKYYCGAEDALRLRMEPIRSLLIPSRVNPVREIK